MLATIPSATLLGARGQPVSVEVHVGTGLPGFTVVGLPDEACRESRDRVRAAVMSSQLRWPSARITVNLAPGGVRKAGSGLDLPIAVGLLVATEQVPAQAVAGFAFVGELGLDGAARRVAGVVPLAASLGRSTVVVPADCVHEAELVATGPVKAATTLARLVEALKAEAPWPEPERPPAPPPPGPPPDLADVRGQPVARRALEAAAAGMHHLLLVGPPGSGKTMLAQRLPGLLPPLDPIDALETTMIHSAANVPLPPSGLVTEPPFRAPHHTASLVAMVGGGSAMVRPGEVSLAHAGVLFLDELGEFGATVLDGLREPLEEGVVRVTRSKASVEFRARFLLVAASNPCPCGAGGAPGQCSCSEATRARYLRRLSGPLLDRFDVRLGVDRPAVDELLGSEPAEPSSVVAARVALARARALERGHGPNGLVPGHLLDEVAPLTPAARLRLRRQLERNRLTGRGLHRVRRLARTLADLDGAGDLVDEQHVAEAIGLRADLLARPGRAVA